MCQSDNDTERKGHYCHTGKGTADTSAFGIHGMPVIIITATSSIEILFFNIMDSSPHLPRF